eukprot:gene5411-9224_t
MNITYLGTSSGMPTKERNVSCITLQLESGELLVFDCGEGTQHQFQKSALRTGKIGCIFITHLHGDHIFGLPGLLCTISGNNPEERTILPIFGPVGLRKFLRTTMALSDSHLSFKLQIFEIVPPEMKDEDLEELIYDEYEEKGGYIKFDTKSSKYEITKYLDFEIIAAPIDHRVFTVGYVLIEKDTIGKLDMEKAKSLGVPKGPLLGKLKSKNDITLEDGKIIKWTDVIGEDIQGRKIVILGDTCDPSGISKIAKNCDIISHESTLENDEQESCIQKGHSTPKMAASFAKSIGAKRLILTHFSARYAGSNVDEKDTRTSINLLKSQAKEIFGESVELAEDFKSFEIKKNK